jgi:hypothetical protein
VVVLVEPNGKCHVTYRDTACPGSACCNSGDDSVAVPGKKYWVRLVRRGNTYSAYTRADPAPAWTPVKELELPLRPSLFVGLAVTARDDGRLATATIDGVSLLPRR